VLNRIPLIGHFSYSSLVDPIRPHPIPPQQAMLVLRQPRQRHEQNPFLGPAGFGSDGEHLSG
jgi:hypothetical protein